MIMKEKSHLYTVILVLVVIFIFSTIFFSSTSSILHNMMLMLLQLACLLSASLAIKMSKRLLIGSFVLFGVPLVMISSFHMYFTTSTKAISCILVGSYFLLLSFVATQTTFLASAWVVEKNKLLISENQKKSFFYIGGITEGFETILCFIMMLLFYEYINHIAYIFGTLCWITFITRVIFIKKLLKS